MRLSRSGRISPSWHCLKREGHALAVFTGVNRRNTGQGDAYLARDAAKAGLEINIVVTQNQIAGRAHTDIENNFTFTHKLNRHAHAGIDGDHNKGR